MFFVSVTSVLIQGSTLSVIAKWLHVSLPERVKPKSSVELFLSDRAKTEMAEIEIPDDCYAVGKEIVELHFPKTSLIAVINRKGKFITPSGSTVIEANDVLIVIADNEQSINQVYECLEINKPV